MLEKIKTIPNRAMNMLSGTSHQDTRPILTRLCRSFRRETEKGLSTLKKRSGDLYPVRELHLAIDNLTNIDNALRRESRSIDRMGADSTLVVLGQMFEETGNLLRTGAISGCMDAGQIAVRTLNLIFAAKQQVKREFGLITPLDLNGRSIRPARLPAHPSLPTVTEIVVPAAMLFQLSQSLFPAERMIVGAASRDAGRIQIKGLFDVTGQASSSGVRADPDALGRALIAMAYTETYFGLWVHSHPGTGRSATHQSGIDINQHADWLKDYSADLVSAIMVKDRYIRFWGTAVESGKITVRIDGAGAECVSTRDNIYKLGI